MHTRRCIDQPDRVLVLGCLFTRYGIKATEELIRRNALRRAKVNVKAQFIHALDNTTEVMTEDFTEYLVDLRRAGLTS